MKTDRATDALAKQEKRATLVVLFCSVLLSTSGCCIPGLRRAQPGAPMPTVYNWNNGVAFGSPDDSQPTDLSGPRASSIDTDVVTENADLEDEATGESVAIQQSDENEAAQLVSRRSRTSVIKAASLLRLNPDGDAKTNEIKDDVSGVEGRRVDGDDHEAFEAELRVEVDRGDGGGEEDLLTDEAVSVPAVYDHGIIDTDIGPSDTKVGLTTLENSAQLPHAAFYNDPYLVGLITETLAGNQELKILAEEIRIACNETYARSGEYRPFVTLGGGAGFDKPGQYTREGAVEDQLEVAPGRDFPEPLADFAIGANVSWEVDIWHRLRNSQRAAAMRYLGTREGRNFIVTRVVAEVAENYYRLLALDNRLITLQATIEIQRQSLKVARANKAAGRATELAVQRFEAEVQKNLSERSLIQQEIVEVENRINFLAGRYPQPVERINVEFLDLNLTVLGAGVPSQLLRNRADIREAERQVAAAGLDVKVARARFYPSLSLTAGLGWNAFSTGYLFQTPESLVYGMAGELVGPLINRRAIKADYCSANAAQLQAIYNYQQTVLEAHIEVVNQITKVENYRQSIEVKKRQLKALERSVDVASQLFQNARAEYIEVLLAQRELMEAKMLLIEIKQEQLAAVVNAYQALGGGGF